MLGGAYGPPDSDSESGIQDRAPPARRSGRLINLRGLAEEGRAWVCIMGEDEFSKTDGSARDARRARRREPARAPTGTCACADQKSRLKAG